MTSHHPVVVGLGRLVDLIVCQDDGGRLRVDVTDDRWLAWDAKGRDLIILRSTGGAGVPATGDAARNHRRFHGAAPKQARPMELPAPAGAQLAVGLVESVTYLADGIHSPSKGGHQWIHHFGDRGEHGRGLLSAKTGAGYSRRCMPRLEIDTAGNLFVVRQPGNTYHVRDWIIG